MLAWNKVSENPPRDHHAVLLYRTGDLYPVVGARWGYDLHGEDPKRVLWALEEGGAGGDERRGCPFLWWEPTHWAQIPGLPEEPLMPEQDKCEHEWGCVSHPTRVYVVACELCGKIRYTEEEERTLLLREEGEGPDAVDT